MAKSQSPAFQGIDFSQWASWPTKVIGGVTYYQIPGRPGFVYSPYEGSNGAIKQDVSDERKRLADEEAKKNAPPGAGEQILQTVGGSAAGIGGLYLTHEALKDGAAPVALGNGKVLTDAGILDSTTGVVTPIGGTTAPSAGVIGTTAQASAPTQVASLTPTAAVPAQGAGVIAAPATEGAAVAPVATTAPAEAGVTGLSGSGLLTNLSSMGASGIPVAGAVIGATALGGKAAYDMLKGEKPGLPGRVILGMATGGLSELAGRFLGHKSTRDVAKEHTAGLLSVAPQNKQYQDYVSGMREQYNDPPPDPSHPFAGKYSNFNEYKKAGLQANDLSGVYGNLKAFGEKWAGLSEEQRQKVTQGIIDAGLYDSKKGEVIITDEDKAKGIYDAVIGPQASEGHAQPKPGETPPVKGQVSDDKVAKVKAANPVQQNLPAKIELNTTAPAAPGKTTAVPRPTYQVKTEEPQRGFVRR